LQSQLQHSQRLEALGTLAGGIAHDLNNTLVPVLALSKLLMKYLPPDDQGRAKLATIHRAGERARDLVRQILAFSRKDTPMRQPVDVAALLRDSLKMIRASVHSTITVDEVIESANLMQAVRISGMFSRVRTRTVMAQAQPYPPLTEATAGQPVTEFRDVTGTLAGFRTPDYEQGISVAGYHLHFINESRTHGGHVLDFEIRQGTATVAVSSELHLSLPRTSAFRTANMSMANIAQQIHQTEGG